MALIRNILTNKIGWFLAVLGLCAFLLLKTDKGFCRPVVSDCIVDLENPFTILEMNRKPPLWFSVIAVAHFPSLIAGYYATRVAGSFFSHSCEAVVKIEMVILPICFIIQWLLVGYFFERLILKRIFPKLK